MNYVLTGQIRAIGNFGILQPESHLSTGATGEKLVHAFVDGATTDTEEIDGRG